MFQTREEENISLVVGFTYDFLMEGGGGLPHTGISWFPTSVFDISRSDQLNWSLLIVTQTDMHLKPEIYPHLFCERYNQCLMHMNQNIIQAKGEKGKSFSHQ